MQTVPKDPWVDLPLRLEEAIRTRTSVEKRSVAFRFSRGCLLSVTLFGSLRAARVEDSNPLCL